ncbi:MAG: T9SS type A sorting domain-containing protein, partial [Melioribacteraceae bacterium]
SVDLLPGEFHIYTSLKLETPEEDILTDIEIINDNIPNEFELYQNYPNPFNPTTTISFAIPVGTQYAAYLQVFDILGREVITLVNENLQPGNYTINFDAGNLSSGVYFYKLTSGSFTQTKKMMLIK